MMTINCLILAALLTVIIFYGNILNYLSEKQDHADTIHICLFLQYPVCLHPHLFFQTQRARALSRHPVFFCHHISLYRCIGINAHTHGAYV